MNVAERELLTLRRRGVEERGRKRRNLGRVLSACGSAVNARPRRFNYVRTGVDVVQARSVGRTVQCRMRLGVYEKVDGGRVFVDGGLEYRSTSAGDLRAAGDFADMNFLFNSALALNIAEQSLRFVLIPFS